MSGNWDSGSFSCLHFGQTGLYPLGTTATRGPSALVILGPHIVNRAWVCVGGGGEYGMEAWGYLEMESVKVGILGKQLSQA